MTKAASARPAPAPRPDAGEALLDVAAALIKRQGFAATSVREIAAAAGMLPGSLHYRYASKEALLVALMERALARVTAAVRAAVAGCDDPAERIRHGLRAHLATLLSGDASFHVLLYDWRSLGGPAQGPLRRLVGRYEAFWDRLLQEAAAAGLARPGVDVELVRQFGFGAVNWVAQWYDPASGRTPAQLADACWAWFAFGLLPESRRPKDPAAAVAAILAGLPQPIVRPPPARHRPRRRPPRRT